MNSSNGKIRKIGFIFVRDPQNNFLIVRRGKYFGVPMLDLEKDYSPKELARLFKTLIWSISIVCFGENLTVVEFYPDESGIWDDQPAHLYFYEFADAELRGQPTGHLVNAGHPLKPEGLMYDFTLLDIAMNVVSSEMVLA